MGQRLQILGHMRREGEINPLMALERYGCMRLAARINELRNRGYKIRSEIRKGHNGKHYAVYSLRGN